MATMHSGNQTKKNDEIDNGLQFLRTNSVWMSATSIQKYTNKVHAGNKTDVNLQTNK